MKSSVLVADLHITDLAHATIPVVVNRYVLYLKYRSVIIVLNVWAIVVSRIECSVHISVANGCCSRIGEIKIELSIRIHREGDSHLIEHNCICIAIDVRISVVGFRLEYKGNKACNNQRQLFHDFQFFS